jgi:lipoate-protein ligase A
MKQNWRFIAEGSLDGQLNMAIDEAILKACGEGKSPPTIRCYGWSRPTLSIGYSQDANQDLDLERCQVMGIPVVTRPTGGRALLHDREFTYSIVASVPHPLFPSNLRGAFQKISSALLLALECMGIEQVTMAGISSSRNLQRRVQSPSCFAALNHWEICWGEKKLMGSAQRRLKNSFLQHGSVWNDCDREFMHSLFRFESTQSADNSLKFHHSHTATLKEICSRLISADEFSQAMRTGFEKAFPIRLIPGELTDYEKKLCERFEG